MSPCRVCGNKTKGEVNRHHLIPKEDRPRNTFQVKIPLYMDQSGCRAHHRFHCGSKKVARSIRNGMRKKEYLWLVSIMGSEWVEETYPKLGSGARR